jgi:segregation and condensation protein B
MTDRPEPDQDREAWSGVGSTRIERVVEALIFAADEALPARRIAGIFAEVTGAERPGDADVEHAVDTLNTRYEAQDRPLRIERWSGGFRMATVPDVAPFVKALLHSEQVHRLSRSLMETLAILAYRQPVTKPEVDFVRGVDSDYAVRRLLELGLVDVRGRADSVGRPLLYGTTDRFLELFGLNALGDLPNLREIESILDDPSFHRERARLLMKAGGLTGLLPGAASPDAAEDPSDG